MASPLIARIPVSVPAEIMPAWQRECAALIELLYAAARERGVLYGNIEPGTRWYAEYVAALGRAYAGGVEGAIALFECLVPALGQMGVGPADATRVLQPPLDALVGGRATNGRERVPAPPPPPMPLPTIVRPTASPLAPVPFPLGPGAPIVPAEGGAAPIGQKSPALMLAAAVAATAIVVGGMYWLTAGAGSSARANPKRRQKGGYYIVDTTVGKVVDGPFSRAEGEEIERERGSRHGRRYQLMDERWLGEAAWRCEP
jgi:hypothetical protein